MVPVEEPRVGPLSEALLPDLVSLLNRWRDGMPEIDPANLASSNTQVIGATLDGRIVGGYVLLSIPMAYEMIGLAINPEYRKRGLGRMCCMDALFRSGKRPLVLTANDESALFAKAVGFKIIGKRKQPDGTFLTRFGWHAPRPTADPSDPASC